MTQTVSTYETVTQNRKPTQPKSKKLQIFSITSDIPRFMSTSSDAGPSPALFCALTLALYFPPLRSFTCNFSNAVSFVSTV